jgi:hypothetical protein
MGQEPVRSEEVPGKGFHGQGIMNLTFYAWMFALIRGLLLFTNDLLGE